MLCLQGVPDVPRARARRGYLPLRHLHADKVIPVLNRGLMRFNANKGTFAEHVWSATHTAGA